MKLFLPLILILLISQRLTAADDAVYRHIDVESGLTNNTIRDIESDNFGYLWVATDEGLNIISGDKVRKFYKSDGDIPLPGNELNALVNDADRNTMWIATQRNGLIGFDYLTRESRYFSKNAEKGFALSGNAITALAMDAAHNLWAGTYASGIDYVDTETGKVTHYNKNNVAGLGSDRIWCLDYDPDADIIYAGHEDGGFSEFFPSGKRATTYTTEDGLPDNMVRKVLIDGNFVWICTDKGISRFNRETKAIQNFGLDRFSGKCRDAIRTGSGILFAYEDEGTVLLDTTNGEFIPVGGCKTDAANGNVPQIVRISKPNTLMEDKFRNIIIGTLDHGLIAISNDTSYFTPGSRVLNHGDDREIANVVSLATRPDGSVWVATENNGIYNKDRAVSGPGAMADSMILDMVADGDGSLWVCDRNGILTNFSPDTGSRTSYDLGMEDNDWVGMDVIGDSIWVSSNSGIVVFDRKRRQLARRYDVENNLIRKVAKDSRGNIYVGTFGQGLAVFDSRMRRKGKNKIEDGFPSNTVNDILIDGDDVWVATGEGLVRFSTGDNHRYEIISHPLKSIRSLMKDMKDNIWFTTGEGVGVVIQRDSVVFFGRELPMHNFNIGSATVDSMGKIYLGSSEGLLEFNPEYVLDEKNLSVPLISGLAINEGSDFGDSVISIAGRKEIVLGPAQGNITIFVSNFDLFRQGDSFEYRMLGLDDKWYPVSEDNKVSFRELPYGKYIFEVRNAKGEGSATLSSLKIEILPPLWLRWWAKLIYVLILVAIVVMVIKNYKKRLENKTEKALVLEKEAHFRELQEERMAFFTNITHELRTPLTLIKGPLDDMVNSETLSSDDKWRIGLIHKNTQRLLHLVNQILDFRKTETRNKRLCVCRDNIVKTVEETTVKFVELNRKRDLNVTVSSSVKSIEMNYDREVLTMILDNLISNAIKYTDKGEVNVSVSKVNADGAPFVEINVRDTGFGIGKDALQHIFDRYYQENTDLQASGTGIGLALVKSLVELHHGRISVESERGKGSCFSVLLPVNEDYPEAMHTEKPEEKEPSPAEAEEREDALESHDNIVVLVIEDNQDILDYIEKSLTGVFEIHTAVNGKEGLEKAEKYLPDVIVSDIMMPVMNGIEMCRRLKENMATSHIPVVLLTAKDSAIDREEGYDVGADSYLVKPFNASLLISRINNIVSRRHMMAEYFRKNVYSAAKDTSEAQESTIESESRQFSESIGKLDCNFVEKIDRIILDSENPDKVNIDYLTDVLCMSRPTLYRKMKAVTGMSGNEYIRHVRMRKAKELLISGEYTLYEIAEKLGFSSPSYFRETFKAVFGTTPSDYLKQLKS